GSPAPESSASPIPETPPASGGAVFVPNLKLYVKRDLQTAPEEPQGSSGFVGAGRMHASWSRHLRRSGADDEAQLEAVGVTDVGTDERRRGLVGRRHADEAVIGAEAESAEHHLET